MLKVLILMAYIDLLLKLKNKINKQKKIQMGIEEGSLLISCYLLRSITNNLPLPMQHYIYEYENRTSFLDPFFEIQKNKILLKQRIPLTQVDSIRESYVLFCMQAKKLQEDLENLSFSFF